VPLLPIVSIAIVARFYPVASYTSKFIVQYSPDDIKWMRLSQVLQPAQKTLHLTEKLLNELSDLNGLVAEEKNSDEVPRFFHTTIEEVQNGWRQLIARVCRVA
jgi:hypothetical protein